MKYFKNRQNPLKGVDISELESCFKCINDLFGSNWLTKKESHPIQQLWHRKDWLATNELFSLGSSLKKLHSINKKWTLNQLHHIKGNDPNNRKGALFEVLGLGSLDTDVLDILPSKIDQAGYDGTIHFKNGSLIRLSLKNFGLSVHHKQFFQDASSLEQLLKVQLKFQKHSSIQVLVDSPKKFASTNDWSALSNAFPGIINSFDNKPMLVAVKDRWIVALNPLTIEGQKLHEKYHSYTLIISSRFHENEELNLFSKFDEACCNLSKNSVKQDINTINIIYIHLPETASILRCADWAEIYLSRNTNYPIAGILLYQPLVQIDQSSNTTSIVHCCQFKYNDNHTKWAQNNPLNSMSFQIPVGKISSSPSELIFKIGDQGVSVNNCYIFQTGHHYINATKKNNGTIQGTISKIASGIFSYLVVKPFQNKPEMVLTGYFPPEDKLLIL